MFVRKILNLFHVTSFPTRFLPQVDFKIALRPRCSRRKKNLSTGYGVKKLTSLVNDCVLMNKQSRMRCFSNVIYQASSFFFFLFFILLLLFFLCCINLLRLESSIECAVLTSHHHVIGFTKRAALFLLYTCVTFCILVPELTGQLPDCRYIQNRLGKFSIIESPSQEDELEK